MKMSTRNRAVPLTRGKYPYSVVDPCAPWAARLTSGRACQAWRDGCGPQNFCLSSVLMTKHIMNVITESNENEVATTPDPFNTEPDQLDPAYCIELFSEFDDVRQAVMDQRDPTTTAKPTEQAVPQIPLTELFNAGLALLNVKRIVDYDNRPQIQSPAKVPTFESTASQVVPTEEEALLLDPTLRQFNITFRDEQVGE